MPSDKETLQGFDAFMIGDIDPSLISRRAQQLIYECVVEEGAGCMFVMGQHESLRRLGGWPLERLLPVDVAIESGKEPGPLPATAVFRWQPTSLGSGALPLQLAESEDDNRELFSRLPPFHNICRFEDVKVGAQVLARTADQGLPLLVAQFAGAGRTALQASEETYRWTSFAGSDDYHQKYWGQLLRWLCRGRLQRSAQSTELNVEPRTSRFGVPLNIHVQLGSEIDEGQLPPSVAVSVSSPQGEDRTLSVPQTRNRHYAETIEDLDPGDYQAVLVQPALADAPMSSFSIAALPGESAELKTDVEAMKSLAAVSRGRYGELKDLPNILAELPTGKAARLGSLPPISLWNSWWVAFAFTALLTTGMAVASSLQNDVSEPGLVHQERRSL